MRFILNFIFFGILFYLIYLFFPEAFKTLVSWVQTVYEFLRDLTVRIVEWVRGTEHTTTTSEPAKALLMLFFTRLK